VSNLPEGFVPDPQPGSQPPFPEGFVPYADSQSGASSAPRPSWAEALGRGALQGATLGFSDELAGVIESVVTDKSYEQARDESRAKNKAAQEAHPWLYGGGELAGGAATALVPGAGVATLGKAALAGAAAGLGGSEADLTKGEFGQAAFDTALGGTVGAVAHGAGKLAGKVLGGAAERVENSELAGLREGVQYSTKLKTFGKATPEAPQGQFTAAIKTALKSEPGIKAAVNKDAHKALSMVDQKVDGLTDTLEHIYTKADAGGAVPVKTAVSGLRDAASAFTTTADEGIADTIRSVGVRLSEKYPEGIPVQALRAEYRGWQNLANKSMKLFSSKSPREEAAEATANALRETLQSHVAEVAEKMPELGISRQALEATNKEVSTWIRVQRALAEKATRQNIGAAPFGDTVNFVGNAIAHPIKTAMKVAGTAALPADRVIARITQMAEEGNPKAVALLQRIGRGAKQAAITEPGAAPRAAMASLGPPPDDQAVAEGP
jgi:hypothetical protein